MQDKKNSTMIFAQITAYILHHNNNTHEWKRGKSKLNQGAKMVIYGHGSCANIIFPKYKLQVLALCTIPYSGKLSKKKTSQWHRFCG